MKIFGTDYDGVIINIEPQKANAFGDILNKKWGIDKDEASQFWMATGGTSRRYKFDYFYKKKFDKQLSDQEFDTIEQEFSNFLKNELYPKLTLLPSAKELLEFARYRFDFLFVSSGVPMEEIQHLVELNSVKKYFDLILGTNEVYKSKRDHFKEIKTKYNPKLFIYVADSPEDMRIGKEFGATTIGVLTNHSADELIKAGAAKVCNLSEVTKVIEGLIEA